MFTQGSSRSRVDAAELAAMTQAGTVILDDRRSRPFYFDGRFLTAKDLTRDQNYFLTRQTDLARASGFGIVQGLLVKHPPNNAASTIYIEAGHGVTPGGELVVLPQSRTVNLVDIPEIQRLDAAFGLAPVPRESARNASGLFIIALRSVEYTANPIASYPTSLTAPRSVNDGDIIEAVAITLIPYADSGSGGLEARRSRVARDIFVEGSMRGLPANALPLAMVGLNRGVVEWIDPYLVRREVGAKQKSLLSFGATPRGLREAYVQQYDQQLQEVLQSRNQSNQGQRFSATDYFAALPPTGQMPSATIDPTNFTQIYFPSTVDVSLSLVPSDELAALVEESLLLPPIDLTMTNEALDSIGVLVLMPVNRQQFQQLQGTLRSLTRSLPAVAPGLVAKRTPLLSLQQIRLPRFPIPIVNPQDLVDAEWRKALASSDLLWFVRRRNLSYQATNVGFNVRIVTNEVITEQNLITTLNQAGLLNRVNTIRNTATAAANADVTSLLSSPKLTTSKLLLSGAIKELEAAKTPVELGGEPSSEKLDQASVLQVSNRFGDPKLGEGILRLEAANSQLKDDAIADTVAQSGTIPELDRLASQLSETELQAFSSQLTDVARTNPSGVGNLIKTTLTNRLGGLR